MPWVKGLTGLLYTYVRYILYIQVLEVDMGDVCTVHTLYRYMKYNILYGIMNYLYQYMPMYCNYLAPACSFHLLTVPKPLLACPLAFPICQTDNTVPLIRYLPLQKLLILWLEYWTLSWYSAMLGKLKKCNQLVLICSIFASTFLLMYKPLLKGL